MSIPLFDRIYRPGPSQADRLAAMARYLAKPSSPPPARSLQRLLDIASVTAASRASKTLDVDVEAIHNDIREQADPLLLMTLDEQVAALAKIMEKHEMDGLAVMQRAQLA